MQVCICAERYKSDFWYQGYTLTLPTYQMALENAKQCASCLLYTSDAADEL